MPDRAGEHGNQAAVASYVATLSQDLATLARRNGLETLTYLLEMVRLEAESVTRHQVTDSAPDRRAIGSPKAP